MFGEFESMFDFSGMANQAHHHGGRQQKCKTVTQKVGNMMTTFTQCS